MVDPNNPSPTPGPDSSDDSALDEALVAAFGSTEDTATKPFVATPRDNSDRPQPDYAPGTLIGGKYKLIERIGEGGMGSVWMAEQREPVKRLVALKLIKKGMDSNAVLARFEAERQALAIMDHPNIAKILDGGITESGLPYFVMELVRGIPITQYCDSRRLSLEHRLELFVPVCNAIQHAHQKGIIHRDIKPSNVIVALYDDRAVPKVIDFGIAKAMGHQSLTERSLHTGFGDVVGTLEYMSPEQASLNNLDIDTRSDVFSLGVLLYELLAGSTPFRRQELQKAGLLEILRVIREELPPKPSTRVSSVEEAPSVSANRASEPKKLSVLLRKELDWVVMKALEKDRTRRYDSPLAFAADVQRYLIGDAVHAHPPSVAYRMRTFARRHRRAILATSFVIGALIAGIVGTTWGMLEAQWQRNVAQAAKNESDNRLNVIRQGNDVLTSIFADINLEEAEQQGEPLSAVLGKRLLAASEQLEKTAIGDPLTVAQMQVKLGEGLRTLGHAEPARKILERAHQVLTRELGADDQATMRCEYFRALEYFSSHDFEAAKSILVPLYERQRRVLGPMHANTLDSMGDVASVYMEFTEFDKAIPLMEENVRLYRQLSQVPDGEDVTLDLITSEHNLGVAYMRTRQFDKARPLLEGCVQRGSQAFGGDHYNVLIKKLSLAIFHSQVSEHQEALSLYRETVSLMTKKVGADHPSTLNAMSHLAAAQSRSGDQDGALSTSKQYYERALRKLGAEHAFTIDAKRTLAKRYEERREFEQALPMRESLKSNSEKRYGRAHAETLFDYAAWAHCLLKLNRNDEAIRVLREQIDLSRSAPGAEDPRTLNMLGLLGDAYSQAGRFSEAIEILKSAFERAVNSLGESHEDTLLRMNNLAMAYHNSGDYESALTLFQNLLQIQNKKTTLTFQDKLTVYRNLAGTTMRLKKFDDAIQLLEEVVSKSDATSTSDHPEMVETQYLLAQAYMNTEDKIEKSVPLLESVLQKREMSLGRKHRATQSAIAALAAVQENVGDVKEAVALRRELVDISKEELGTDHERTLKHMELLTRAQGWSTDFESAIPVMRELVELRTAKLGPTHADTIVSLARLATAMESALGFKPSVDHLREVISVREVVNTELKPDQANAGKSTLAFPEDLYVLQRENMLSLAELYERAGDKEKAISLSRNLVTISESALGRTHKETQMFLGRLGASLVAAGHHDEGLKLLEERAANTEFHKGTLAKAYIQADRLDKLDVLLQAERTQPKNLHIVLDNCASAFSRKGDFTRAEEMERENSKLLENQKESLERKGELWLLHNARSKWGAILTKLKRFEEAQPLLMSGYEGLVKLDTAKVVGGQTLLPAAIERLIEYFEETNNESETIRWKETLDSFQKK